MSRRPVKKRMTNGDKSPVKHEAIEGSKKPGCIFDSYYDMFFFKQKPIPYAYLERLSEDLLKWSQKDTSLRIESFWIDCGICDEDYYRFVERCEPLKRAHDLSLKRIAIRRDTGALTKKFDASWTARTQAAFDPEYRKARKFEAELQKDVQSEGPKVVIIERMPNTTEVKVKKEENE